MIKRYLLFSIFAGFSAIALMSNDAGPAQANNGNRTGGPGNSGTCASSGCHGANTANTAVLITLKDVATNVTVVDGKYKPLRTYDVELKVTNPSFNHFGFQAMALKGDNTNGGVISAGSGTHMKAVGGRNLIEHHTAISGNTVHFTWVSPHAGTGNVTFYAMGNAVNDDGNTGGDAPSNPYSIAFAESTTSVSDVAQQIQVTATPNPVTNTLQVSMGNANGTYTVIAFDMNGKKVAEQTATAQNSKVESTLNAANWTPGLYHVQLVKDGVKYTTPVVKQ